MFKNIGQLQGVPSPSSEVVTRAMDLLIALGAGDKTMKKTLQELKEIQLHNEEVSKSAKTSLDSIVMMNMDLKRREGFLKSDIEEHDIENKKIRDELEMLKNRAELRIKTNEEAIINRNEDLNKKSVECEHQRMVNESIGKTLAEDTRYLNVQLAKLKQDRAICDKESQDLNKTRESLKTIFGS